MHRLGAHANCSHSPAKTLPSNFLRGSLTRCHDIVPRTNSIQNIATRSTSKRYISWLSRCQHRSRQSTDWLPALRDGPPQRANILLLLDDVISVPHVHCAREAAVSVAAVGDIGFAHLHFRSWVLCLQTRDCRCSGGSGQAAERAAQFRTGVLCGR